jgi:hypothetical protein
MSLVGGTLHAQTDIRRVGLGMAITSIGAGGAYGIYVPLALSSRVRLEPELAVSIDSYAIDAGGTVQEVQNQYVQVGVGLFRLVDAGTSTKVYIGPRAGIAWSHQKRTDEVTGDEAWDALDWFVAAAAGGEYFLAPRFSLGGEVRLGFYQAGEANGSGTPLFTYGSRFTTGAGAFVRWYL